jgi:pyrimidine 5'-nucleotidase
MALRARQRRIAQPRGPVWLFDLDNTLHHASHAVFPQINQAMTNYIVRALHIDHGEADRLRVHYTQRYGAALLGLARHHPLALDPHDFLAQVHCFQDLPSMLRAERGLARLLRALPGRRILLTNGPYAYARAVLDALGIAALFEQVIAIEQMQHQGRWHAKPDAGMLRRALRRARVRTRDATLVEDTRSHLKRYKRLGLRTVWMVGHLPPVPRGSGGPPSLPGAGRAHYIDSRVRSIKSLRKVPGNIRLDDTIAPCPIRLAKPAH